MEFFEFSEPCGSRGKRNQATGVQECARTADPDSKTLCGSEKIHDVTSGPDGRRIGDRRWTPMVGANRPGRLVFRPREAALAGGPQESRRQRWLDGRQLVHGAGHATAFRITSEGFFVSTCSSSDSRTESR